MTAVALQPGDLLIDMSGMRMLDAAHIKIAKDAGCKGVMRYSAGVGNGQLATKWKLCSPEEFRALLAAGFDIVANSEWYESRITEGGTAGRADGAADLIFWRWCGLAQGSSIYVSWDAAPNPALYAQVAAYLNNYQAALGVYYFVDIYAGDPVITEMMKRKLVRYGWHPNAQSWSNNDLPYQPDTSTLAKRLDLVNRAKAVSPAHILQTGNYWFDKNADENVVIRMPLGSHLHAIAGGGVVPAHPQPGPVVHPAKLHRQWPSYMKRGEYFGDIHGPVRSHGGFNVNERPDIAAIKARLTTLGYHGMASNGIFGGAAIKATAAWQEKVAPRRTANHRGQIWPGDWARLFTY